MRRNVLDPVANQELHAVMTPSKGHMNWTVPVWKHVFWPVLLLTLLWITMGIATIYYVHWIDNSYQRIFRENLASIRAGDDMQQTVWRVAGNWPTDTGEFESFQANWISLESDLVRNEERLRQAAHTPDEQAILETTGALLSELRAKVASYTVLMEETASTNDLSDARREVRDLIGLISARADELKEVNEQIIDAASDRRNHIATMLVAPRITLIASGPLFGIWLGWRLAHRVNESFSRILVTLRDGASSDDHDLATVALDSNGSAVNVERQAEYVVQRLRRVSDELRMARGEAIRSERLAAVGGLAAGVAHELRNPLTSIKLLLQHASKQLGESLLSESKLRLILDEIGRMEATIQGLLDFSRPRTLKRSRFDVREAIQRALNLVDGRARHQAIELFVSEVSAPLVADGDIEQLHQVFVNLFLNAIEAMPESGQLYVEPALIDGGQKIQVSVRDTGEGIAPTVMPRLFEPFATTKERGTGLGLAVSRRIIEEHGGALTAENQHSRGAVFYVVLPSAEANSAVAWDNARNKAEPVMIHGKSETEPFDALRLRPGKRS